MKQNSKLIISFLRYPIQLTDKLVHRILNSLNYIYFNYTFKALGTIHIPYIPTVLSNLHTFYEQNWLFFFFCTFITWRYVFFLFLKLLCFYCNLLMFFMTYFSLLFFLVHIKPPVYHPSYSYFISVYNQLKPLKPSNEYKTDIHTL